MSDPTTKPQCRARIGDVRCQRFQDHIGHHRAETGNRVQDWAERTKR